MGNLNSGRPGGNPLLSQYKFQPDGDEGFSAHLQLRITQSMMDELKLQEDKNKFVREAIAEKLAREAIAS